MSMQRSMPSSLVLHSQIFTLVKVQRDGESAIYRSGDTFLRLGERERINRDRAFHQQMIDTGFPVAQLLGEGEYEGQRYYLESSLGDQYFGELFAEETKNQGEISDKTFEAFVLVTQQFVRAQLATRSEKRDEAHFVESLHLSILLEELPAWAPQIEARFNRCMQALCYFPFVLTHADYNPHNLYPLGIIDFEDATRGPIGYDVVSAIVSINYFPSVAGYEFMAQYQFTQEQRRQYFDVMDSLFIEAGLPPVSQYEEEFEFFRAIWLLVRMEKWPKIQQFRYSFFEQRFLSR